MYNYETTFRRTRLRRFGKMGGLGKLGKIENLGTKKPGLSTGPSLTPVCCRDFAFQLFDLALGGVLGGEAAEASPVVRQSAIDDGDTGLTSVISDCNCHDNSPKSEVKKPI